MASTCFERYLLILRKRYTSGTWYTACVLCQLAAAGSSCSQLIQHARNIPSAVYVAPPEDEQVMHETCEEA
jgi:hypothetical protein